MMIMHFENGVDHEKKYIDPHDADNDKKIMTVDKC